MEDSNTKTPSRPTIHDWAIEDKPREKLLLKGPGHLSDLELLTILIGTGTRNKTAYDLARELLISVDNRLDLLRNESIQEICKIPGIGPAKAVNVMAALELSGRVDPYHAPEICIISSTDAYRYMRKYFTGLLQEEFWIMLLDTKKYPVFIKKIAVGTLTMVPVDLRIIGSYICKLVAHSIVVFHNHPSGNCQPSYYDHQLTQKIREICELFNCNFMDHVIVGKNDFYSMSDAERIDDIAASN